MLIVYPSVEFAVVVQLLSRVQPPVTPWTAAHQAPPSMGVTRQEYWSRVPLQRFLKIDSFQELALKPSLVCLCFLVFNSVTCFVFYFSGLVCFVFFLVTQLIGSLFPDQGLNPGPQ